MTDWPHSNQVVLAVVVVKFYICLITSMFHAPALLSLGQEKPTVTSWALHLRRSQYPGKGLDLKQLSVNRTSSFVDALDLYIASRHCKRSCQTCLCFFFTVSTSLEPTSTRQASLELQLVLVPVVVIAVLHRQALGSLLWPRNCASGLMRHISEMTTLQGLWTQGSPQRFQLR